MTDFVETANAAIAAIEAAADRLAQACRAEMELEDQRPLMKTLAIRRLMTTENRETQKPHSASSAEKIVESDPEFAAHRARQANAVVETITARGAFEAAKRRADVAIDMGMLLSSSADLVEPRVGHVEYDAKEMIRALQDYAARTLGVNMPVSAVLDL